MRVGFWMALAAVLLIAGFVFGRGLVSPDGGDVGVTEVTIDGYEYGFDPHELVINRGDTVRIVFRNTGAFVHDWVIPDWNVATPIIAGGEEAVVEFRAERAGTVRFVCTVPGHDELGMNGTLTVR